MIISIVAVGDHYIDLCCNKIKNLIEIGFIVKILTDKPEKFTHGETYKYDKKIFSFFDKILFTGKISEESKTGVLYIDADYIKNIDFKKIKNINHTNKFLFFDHWWIKDNNVEIIWKKINDNKDEVEYYKPLNDFCELKKFDINRLTCLWEGAFYFPYLNNISKILFDVETIKPIFEYMSIMKRNNYYGKLGAGEGLGLSYAIENNNESFEMLGLTDIFYFNDSPMKIIFVNWTKPFFNKKELTGFKKISTSLIDTDEYELLEHEKIIQIASITSAKKYSGLPIKLYTDNIGYEYYKKVGMIELFDEINLDVLNNLNNKDDINSAQFWTSGKIISICNETPPFIFIDLDLIIKSDIPDWIYKYDVVHTHWELTRNSLSINEDKLKEFNINIDCFQENMLIPNTSFLFINNDNLLQEYLKLHLKIVTGKYEYVPDWLWLMSDQNILGYLLRKFNLQVGEIENRLYIQFPDDLESKSKPGYVPNWINFDSIEKNNPKIEYEHLWLDKYFINTNDDFRNSKIKEWSEIIRNNGFESQSNIEIQELKKRTLL